MVEDQGSREGLVEVGLEAVAELEGHQRVKAERDQAIAVCKRMCSVQLQDAPGCISDVFGEKRVSLIGWRCREAFQERRLGISTRCGGRWVARPGLAIRPVVDRRSLTDQVGEQRWDHG